MTPRRKIGLGLLGSGVVGEAIQDIVLEQTKGFVGSDLELDIRRIYTREPRGKKWYERRPELFTSNAREVIGDPSVEIVIEALGFQEADQVGQFRDYILEAFAIGKSVVTSDKAVLARYGTQIWAAAEKHGKQLRFEACVGGGIPIVRSLTESFAVEEPEAIFGIMNGTCNYILSQMEKTAQPYEEALKGAQEKGYAETNPASDVSGSDAEAKLLLLAAVAFGVVLEPGTILRKGIDQIHAVDFQYAGRTGSGSIKQLAVAKRTKTSVQLFVSPVLLPRTNLLAGIEGATNAICFKGKKSGGSGERDSDYVLVGPGAGGGPTAVAILGDVCELARGGQSGFSGLPSLIPPGTLTVQSRDAISGSFYVRFIVKDRPGIVGDIGHTFGALGVNISEIWQVRHSEDEIRSLVRSYRMKGPAADILPFVITLERATVRQVTDALATIRNREYMLMDPVWFPIWE